MASSFFVEGERRHAFPGALALKREIAKKQAS
jgi:hypothetical protein